MAAWSAYAVLLATSLIVQVTAHFAVNTLTTVGPVEDLITVLLVSQATS